VERKLLTRVDGRLARSERSRRAVVGALLDLFDAGDLRPTAAQIAQRAGVSLRSVFQHFESLETLFAAAADLQMERLAPLLTPIPTDGPFAGRLATFVTRRARVLEAIAPVRRASLRMEPFSNEVRTRLEAARGRGRREAERVFATELAALPVAERREVAAALGAAASWSNWEHLRRHQGLGVDRARRVMARMLASALGRPMGGAVVQALDDADTTADLASGTSRRPSRQRRRTSMSQQGAYRIFGSELSPYSVKVRSYFRYKGIPHQWIPRSAANEEEFRRLAKLPLVPLVVAPDGSALQDSTPILEHFEARHPEPSIHPGDPALAFLSALLEEYGDEWGNKPMFHYRWSYEADQLSAGERLARGMMPDIDDASLPGAIDMVRSRMVSRLKLVGSSAETRDVIEGSFRRQVAILERHLASRPYLFGGRPAFGDFGVFAQLHQCSTDPTPGAVLRASAPGVLAWIGRMLDPKAEGPFEAWPALAPTLEPMLRDEVAGVFFPWTVVNAAALAEGRSEMTVEIGGRPFAQEPQKYHAKSLAALRARYAAVADRAALDAILGASGCRGFLAAG
jgi:glutathione S-transferase/AcrR family transcriptional regulator